MCEKESVAPSQPRNLVETDTIPSFYLILQQIIVSEEGQFAERSQIRVAHDSLEEVSRSLGHPGGQDAPGDLLKSLG
jgi:hypothetical protein